MYNNSYYSHSKLGVSTKKIHKARGKSCGYYLKIVFFFSSLIQTLIIVSLVLFLIYGQPEESATEKRLQELDPMHNELKARYGYLLEEHRNLTRKMNRTNRQMEFMHGNITMLRKLGNQSAAIIMELQMSLISRSQITQPQPCNCPRISPTPCQLNGQPNALQLHENNQLKSLLEIVKKNFSDTVQALTTELKNAKDEKITLKLAKITLGQEKATLENEIKLFKKKCEDDFIKSLEGFPEMTKAFRQKIDTLFPHMIPFHISCEKQHEQMEQIRNNCSSLSAQVENKFQPYLNDFVYKLSDTMHRISHFHAKSLTLGKALDECNKNLSSQKEKHYYELRDTVVRFEKQEEQHLLDIKKSNDAKELLNRILMSKEIEIKMLQEKINTTLANCGHRPPSPKPGSNTSPGYGGPGLGSTGNMGPSGAGFGNAGSFVAGGSRTPFSGTGSSTSGLGNPGFGGAGSSRTGPSGTGSSTSGLGNPSFGGAGSSRTGPSGTGSSMTGFGGYGSLGSGGTGAGRTGMVASGLGRTGPGGMMYGGGGALDPISKHLKELQKYANPEGQ